MKTSVFLVLFVTLGSTLAKPSTLLGLPTLTYTAHSSGGAPVGVDGRVVDTPEVAIAKVQHAAAQLNERANLADEAARSGDIDVSRLLLSQTGLPLLRALATNNLASASIALAGKRLNLASLDSDTPGAAPVGTDGRVVDTPAVAQAKAEHAAAHLNEKLNLSNEATRNSGLITIAAPSALALRL